MSVRLHIDRVVVEGLPMSPRDRHALGQAVERELGLLMRGRRGWPARDVALRSVTGRPLTVTPGQPVRAVGRQVARAIDAGIGTAVPR